MVAVTETLPSEKGFEEKITRFDAHQIIQHWGLMVSFILLVITGVPLKFNDWAISQWWIGSWGGLEATRSIHHFAAWVMVFVSVYHLGYLVYSIFILKKPFPVKMLPSYQDFIEFFQEVAYFLGLRKERPKFDRFNWREKVEYWAIFWGITAMAGSGFILMYPVLVTKVLPGWMVPTALVIHSFEAMMALVWIVLVHIFFSHFTPGVFPINTSIFTGKVSKERYSREHPLEYERLLGTDEQKEENDNREEVATAEAEEKSDTGEEE
ncbi:MAG: cytochrome b/b6 domain-containing protein [Chloroflexi bacterium]|nr:cytochrome b/b6 domain-containing protein [Chloroflexota bacterium]